MMWQIPRTMLLLETNLKDLDIGSDFETFDTICEGFGGLFVKNSMAVNAIVKKFICMNMAVSVQS